MILPEYLAGEDNNQLHPCVILKLSDKRHEKDLREVLLQCRDVYRVADLLQEKYLLVYGHAGTDVDRFLLSLEEEIVRFNQRLDDLPGLEIIDSRLVPYRAAAKQQCRLTPHILLKFDKAEFSPEPKNMCHIFLDAGHVFGSGQHPSTRLAAIALEDCFQGSSVPPTRVLDVGCGSGILSLICAKMGALEVLGVDIDAEARQIARNNVKINKLSGQVTITDTTLQLVEGDFDLLVANMTPSVLMAQAQHFSRLLRQEGQLIIAGFQQRQLRELTELMYVKGFDLIKSYEEKGSWQAARFRFG